MNTYQPPLYNAVQAAKDAAYWQPYVDICQLDTPGFDHEERREPKTGPIANRRNRPGAWPVPPKASVNDHNAVERHSDRMDKDRDRHNEALAA